MPYSVRHGVSRRNNCLSRSSFCTLDYSLSLFPLQAFVYAHYAEVCLFPRQTKPDELGCWIPIFIGMTGERLFSHSVTCYRLFSSYSTSLHLSRIYPPAGPLVNNKFASPVSYNTSAVFLRRIRHAVTSFTLIEFSSEISPCPA